MVKSIIFDKKNTLEDAYETVIDLGDAEKILMWVQANV